MFVTICRVKEIGISFFIRIITSFRCNHTQCGNLVSFAHFIFSYYAVDDGSSIIKSGFDYIYHWHCKWHHDHHKWHYDIHTASPHKKMGSTNLVLLQLEFLWDWRFFHRRNIGNNFRISSSNKGNNIFWFKVQTSQINDAKLHMIDYDSGHLSWTSKGHHNTICGN